MDKSLSNDEIKDFFDGNVNVITYEDLPKYRTIDELLSPYDMTVLLFLTRPNYGHWTCLFRTPDNEISFFDSYGYKPDSELKHIDKRVRQQTNQDYAYLSKLLYESPYPIEYNEHKFQRKEKGVNTCGRWVIMRLLFRDFDLEAFEHLFKKPGADEIISQLTYFI